MSRPLVITDGDSTETNITLRAYTEGTRTSSDQWDEFRIFSWTVSRFEEQLLYRKMSFTHSLTEGEGLDRALSGTDHCHFQ